MSIWRSITCKCGCGYFDVADNGLDDNIRLNCRNCDEQIILERQSITLENLLLMEMKKLNDKDKVIKEQELQDAYDLAMQEINNLRKQIKALKEVIK